MELMTLRFELRVPVFTSITRTVPSIVPFNNRKPKILAYWLIRAGYRAGGLRLGYMDLRHSECHWGRADGSISRPVPLKNVSNAHLIGNIVTYFHERRQREGTWAYH